MNKKQALEIIKKLESIYPRGFASEFTKAEYAESLKKLDFAVMLKAIEKVKTEGIRKKDGTVNVSFLPSIAELCDVYRQLNAEKTPITKNTEYCYVCRDNGFITLKHKHDELGIDYEYAYYCPFCNAGKQYIYDGRDCNERKSPYYIEPLTSVLTDKEIDGLKQRNKAAKKIYADDKIRMQFDLQKIGKCMPKISVSAESDDSWVSEI